VESSESSSTLGTVVASQYSKKDQANITGADMFQKEKEPKPDTQKTKLRRSARLRNKRQT